MTPYYVAAGDTVRVNGWGLSGTLLKVGEHMGDGYFRLTFVHNGNQLPSYYHEKLMERVA